MTRSALLAALAAKPAEAIADVSGPSVGSHHAPAARMLVIFAGTGTDELGAVTLRWVTTK